MAYNPNFPVIFSANRQPFTTFTEADFMRDQLNEVAPEYGFQIVEHPEGGFILQQTHNVKAEQAVAREQLHHDTVEAAATVAGAVDAKDPTLKLSQETQAFVAEFPIILRPAWRNYFVRFLVATGFFLFAFKVTEVVRSLVPQEYLSMAYRTVPQLDTLLMGFFLFIALYHILVIVKRVYSNTYTISRDGIRGRHGIVARDAHAIKYKDICGIGLEQDVFQRLLGVGTLEFFTAGSDGADVIFENIAFPAYYRDQLDAVANAYR